MHSILEYCRIFILQKITAKVTVPYLDHIHVHPLSPTVQTWLGLLASFRYWSRDWHIIMSTLATFPPTEYKWTQLQPRYRTQQKSRQWYRTNRTDRSKRFWPLWSWQRRCPLVTRTHMIHCRLSPCPGWSLPWWRRRVLQAASWSPRPADCHSWSFPPCWWSWCFVLDHRPQLHGRCLSRVAWTLTKKQVWQSILLTSEISFNTLSKIRGDCQS